MLNLQKMVSLRKNLNMQQKQLAKEVGVSNASMCGYEKGNKTPDYDTFKKICITLKTTPNYLLDFDVKVKVKNDNKIIYISNDDYHILNELRKYDKLYIKISSDPKKWFNKINDRFN